MSTREENRHELTGPGDAERGLGHYHVAYVFVFLGTNSICRLYKLTLSDEHQVSLKIRASLSDLVYRFLAGPSLLGEGNFFF
jgi:hypothetical protein